MKICEEGVVLIPKKKGKLLKKQNELGNKRNSISWMDFKTRRQIEEQFRDSTKGNNNNSSIDPKELFRTTRGKLLIKSNASSHRESGIKINNLTRLDLKDVKNDNVKKLLESMIDAMDKIPPVVEQLASRSQAEKAKSTTLSTDRAVDEYLKLRHVVNHRLLHALKDKGVTMPQVELSIYNTKNRKNSFGQGQLIQRCETQVDTAI